MVNTADYDDMERLNFKDQNFDWVWSMDCVGYAPEDPVAVLKEIASVVKPGGGIYILAWSSQQLLPGCPKLEARLNATAAGIAPFVEGQSPNRHFLTALGWFKAAGFEDCCARIYAGSVQAPFSDQQRKALVSLFEMRWAVTESDLDES